MRKMMLSAEDLATFHRIVFSAAGDESGRGNDIRWMARKIQELQPDAEELVRYRLKRLLSARISCQFRIFELVENGDCSDNWTRRAKRIERAIAEVTATLELQKG